MPTARKTDHRIRPGTFGSSGITSTYSITAFAIQSDQYIGNVLRVPWIAPFQALPPQVARIAQNLDGSARPDGFLHGVLPFDLWTFGMNSYITSTFYTAGAQSALVSMMLYDEADSALFLNATLYKPVPGQDMDPIMGGWQNIKWRYDFGEITS